MARHHHLAGQPPEQLEEGRVVGLGVVVAVVPVRQARRTQVRRIAVDQLRAPEREGDQERVGAAVHQRAPVQVDADRAQRRRLAPHQRAAAKVRLHVGAVRGKQPQKRLAQPARRL